MSEVRIPAEPRTEFGKGAARRVRRADKVPAVVYGHHSDPRHVSLPGHELMIALKQGANVLLRLDFTDGDSELVLPRNVTRDPIKGFLEHVDLLVVAQGEQVRVDVPVHHLGSVVSGGLLDVQHNTIPVQAEATHIPDHFEVVLDGLEVGASVHARDIVLPPGATLAGDPDAVIVHVMPAPTAEQIEAELAESEAELGAGAASGIEIEAAQEEAEGEAAGELPTGMGDAVATPQPGSPDESQTPDASS